MALIESQLPSNSPIMSYSVYDNADGYRSGGTNSIPTGEDDSDDYDDGDGYDYSFVSLVDSNVSYSIEDMIWMDKEKRESIIDYLATNESEVGAEIIQFLEGRHRVHLFNAEHSEARLVLLLLTQFKRLFSLD